MVHVTVIRATTGTPRPFNDFYPLANVPHVRTCEISRVSVRVCARARVCIPRTSGVQSSSVVVQAKSPRYILFKRLAPWPPWQRVFALRHFATLLFLPSYFSLSFSLSLSLLSFIIHLESMIKHDENRMGIESNGAKVLFFFEKLGIETPLSISSLVLFSSGAGDENVSPSLLLPGRR